ncbi:MAG: cation:proton antiporter [Dysgonomonas sp.]
MKKHKNLIFYVSIIGVLSVVIYIFQSLGKEYLEDPNEILHPVMGEGSAWRNFLYSLWDSIMHPLSILLFQIVAILIVVRIFGWICKKIGQPTVVGEIIAGVVLGPSLLGLYFPEVSAFIFPESSLSNISLLSQIGLILFMFIVGLELDFKVLKNKANDAIVISHAGIIIPFTLGVILSYIVYNHFAYQHTSFLSFSLFMGVAMSIAAFPVMARIIHERGINKTPLGAFVITCAAFDDITAWCLLAAIIAVVKAGSFASAIFTIITTILYIMVMFGLVRPFLKRIADLQTSRNIISKSIIGIFFIILFLSAYTTEVIGIHALFGAFLTGVIMPPNLNFRKLFIEKIEDVSLVLLLPLFFVYTGLRTQIGLLNDSYLWGVCGGIVLVAVVGKFGGTMLAARFTGQTWRNSLTIGTLMNTRGLMELVVLNIGYDLGVFPPQIFAMMVVMALTTTFMTSPTLDLIDRLFKGKPDVKDAVSAKKKYRMIISFENSEMGKKLLLLANSFVKREQSNTELTLLHLSQGNNLYQYNIDQEEHDTFDPVIEEAEKLHQPVIPVFEVSSETNVKVAKIANKGEYDLLLIGESDSIYEGNILGNLIGLSNKLVSIPNIIIAKILHNKRSSLIRSGLDDNIQMIIAKSDLPVGIFIDKGLESIKNVFIPIFDENDMFIGEYMEKLARNSYVRITLWDAIGLSDKSIDFIKSVRAIKEINPYLFLLWNNNILIGSDILQKQDLILISLNSWRKLHESDFAWKKSIPSALIIDNNN